MGGLRLSLLMTSRCGEVHVLDLRGGQVFAVSSKLMCVRNSTTGVVERDICGDLSEEYVTSRVYTHHCLGSLRYRSKSTDGTLTDRP